MRHLGLLCAWVACGASASACLADEAGTIVDARGNDGVSDTLAPDETLAPDARAPDETLAPDARAPDETLAPDDTRGPDDAALVDANGPADADPPLAGCAALSLVVAEGDEVPPQTVLHLSVSGLPEGVTIVWRVSQPSGAVSTFTPSPYATNVSFEVNVVGAYTFVAEVHIGTLVCELERTVATVVRTRLRIELLWRTPGDANPYDTGGDQVYTSAGSDLDLHLVHPEGTYFDPLWDCYWDACAYGGITWAGGAAHPSPRLERDDTDGSGPENLAFDAPEVGLHYRLAVHVRDDFGYGPSYATLRVYVDGLLAEQWADVELVDLDLWEAFDLDVGADTIALTRVAPAPAITPGFGASAP